MPSTFHRLGDLADIGNTIGRLSKKMKDSPVVPHVVSGGRQLDLSDVGDEPMDTLRSFS
jgi:hypothetical protein